MTRTLYMTLIPNKGENEVAARVIEVGNNELMV